MITSVDIERRLYQKAKVAAIMEGTSLKEIINRALEEYLKDKPILIKRRGKIESPNTPKKEE